MKIKIIVLRGLIAISFVANLLFFIFFIQYLFVKKDFEKSQYSLKKIFSNKDFDLVTANMMMPTNDFALMAKHNNNEQSIICMIRSPRLFTLSWDLFIKKKITQNFAWETNYDRTQERPWYYCCTFNNVKYYAYSKDLIWTYKRNIDKEAKIFCMYNGVWIPALKYDIKKMIFELESGQTLVWNSDMERWCESITKNE